MLALYHGARTLGMRPALLESLGPRTSFARLSLLGVRPRHRLEVLEGRLYLDGKRVGEALEIFRYLERGLGRGFFPAWIGFFAYEFARHLGLPTHRPLPGLPEAFFFYYLPFRIFTCICIDTPIRKGAWINVWEHPSPLPAYQNSPSGNCAH